MRIFLIFSLLFLASANSNALEVTAGTMGMQAGASSGSSSVGSFQLTATNKIVKNIKEDVEKVLKCNAKEKFYAPTKPGADADGCSFPVANSVLDSTHCTDGEKVHWDAGVQKLVCKAYETHEWSGTARRAVLSTTSYTGFTRIQMGGASRSTVNHWHFEELPPGDYKVTVNYSGVDRVGTFTVSGGSVTSQSLTAFNGLGGMGGSARVYTTQLDLPGYDWYPNVHNVKMEKTR